MGHSPIPQSRGDAPCNPLEKMYDRLHENSG
jgi:hypothetical protein